LSALGAPEWHGRNFNALIDSMIRGGINKIEAPYTLRIRGLSRAPAEVRKMVGDAKQALDKAQLTPTKQVVFEIVN